MKFNKKINGFRVIVKDWSSIVQVIDLENNNIIKESTCSDHIKAVLIAKKLTSK